MFNSILFVCLFLFLFFCFVVCLFLFFVFVFFVFFVSVVFSLSLIMYAFLFIVFFVYRILFYLVIYTLKKLSGGARRRSPALNRIDLNYEVRKAFSFTDSSVLDFAIPIPRRSKEHTGAYS